MAEEYDTMLYESTSTLISVVSRRKLEKEECTHEMPEGLNGNRKHGRGWNSSHCFQNPILRYQGKFSKDMSRENIPQDGDVPCAVDAVRPELFVDVAERIDEQWDGNARLFEPFGRERVLLYEHSDCLAVKALLLMCNLKCKFESIRNAEDLSMNGYIPVMLVENILLSGFDEILLYLVRKDIVSFQNLKNLDYLFLHSLVHGILRKAELYICWVMEEVFQQVTLVRFSAAYSWPAKMTLPYEKRKEVLKLLKCHRWLEKSPEEVFDEVEYACECLSTKLGTNPYFSGNNPTEIDALIFGHLYTLLTTSLPNVAIEEYDTMLYESTSTLISVVSRRKLEKEECTHEMPEGLNGNRKHGRGWNSSHCFQNPILRYQGKFSKDMSRENIPQDGDVPCAVDAVRPELFVDVAERIDEQWDGNARLFEPFGRERVLLYEHSDCLAVKALLLMCNLKCKFESIRNAEDLSMNGYIPVMLVENILLSGFDEILLYLVRKDIVSFQNLKNLDYLFLQSLVHGILRKAELYICWVMEEVTLVRFSAAYSWPAKMTLPYEKRKEVLELLKCHRWLEKSPDEVFDEVEYACECLSMKLGAHQYFSGNNPTEIDALIFGHLYTLLTTSLPNVAIGDILKKFPNLLQFCEDFEKLYFSLLPMLNA
ncbi:Metaxin-2 [Trichinella murrelli]|uniref:Metaxin-2 n=1 Tax=Trichinella murrelli TaxID=144512 RepID=A0A0V0TY90_9BILA|nr:Metaxin-2 [Trichinella murrelli]